MPEGYKVSGNLLCLKNLRGSAATATTTDAV
jgi:hypothetical protein